jgi:hypothetical protein
MYSKIFTPIGSFSFLVTLLVAWGETLSFSQSWVGEWMAGGRSPVVDECNLYRGCLGVVYRF